MNTDVARAADRYRGGTAPAGLVAERAAARPQRWPRSSRFCVDTLSLPQWLQFVFLPRLYLLLERNPLPDRWYRAHGAGVLAAPGWPARPGAGPAADRRVAFRGSAAGSEGHRRRRARLDALQRTVVMPWPRPIHMVDTPRVRSRSSITFSREPVIREQPKGWPRAMAPPCTFTFVHLVQQAQILRAPAMPARRRPR